MGWGEAPRCEQAGCPGHLGKFQSCQDEAIWQSTLDGADRETGNAVDWDAHYSLVTFEQDETVVMDDDDRHILVPAGSYIVQGMSSGAVYVERYETLDAASAAMDEHERAYELAEGPQEDDAVIEDTSRGYSVSMEGKHLGYKAEWDDAVTLLRRAMDSAQYWPNAWHVNDHGNHELLTLGD